MANTNTAAFAQTQQHVTAVVTTAVALTGVGSLGDDAPANTVLLCTAGANPGGSLLTVLSALPRATVTATLLCVWSSLDAGTTKRLVMSALMPAATLAATTQIVPTVFKHADNSTVISETAPYRLQPGEKLYVGTSVFLASGIVFNGTLTDF